MNNYNDFCRDIGCEEYIEWDYEFEPCSPPYPCTSCQKVGQSYDIDAYPDDCPHLMAIQMIVLEHNNE